MRSSPASLTASLSVVLALAGALGCGGSSGASEAASASTGAPPGAVVRVDRDFITGEEIDQWVDVIGLIEPAESLPSLRRKALANICMPRAVARQLDPEAREAALARASSAFARVQAGDALPADGPQLEVLEGHWRGDFGLDVWGLAWRMPLGEWSGVHETVGGFTFFRVLEAPSSEEWDLNTKIRVERWFIPYLPPEAPFLLLQEAVDQAEFEVVDPEWEELVPAHFKYSRDTIR